MRQNCCQIGDLTLSFAVHELLAKDKMSLYTQPTHQI